MTARPRARAGWCALLAVLVVTAGCADEAASPGDDDVVAAVGDGVVTAGEFAEAYAQTVLRAGVEGPGAAEAVLTSLVNRRLLIEAAKDDGVEEKDAYRAARDLAEAKALVDLYTAREMAPALVVTDADLREQFVQMHTTYDARHLYARDEAAARRLRERLLAGETFEALARETFADPTLAASGGAVGPFGHDEMDPAFEAAAFRLPIGEVSEPVRTATGYSVLRVDARATSPLLTEAEFDRRRKGLARYVRKRKRTEARFDLSRRVRDDLGVRFDEAAFDRLVGFATGAAGLDAEGAAQWRRTPLVRFTSAAGGAGVWTVGDVEDRAASMTERQRAAVQDAASLREFVEGLLVREELVARARASGLDRDPRYDRAVQAQTDDWVFNHAKRQLRGGAVPDDSLYAEYRTHGDRYQTPERVEAAEILVATRAEADGLLRQIRGGADFGDLARRHSLRPAAAEAGGSLGPVTRDQVGRLGDALFAAAPGAVVGPVEVAGRYVLLKRGETAPPRPMTYAEARPLVRDALDVRFAQRRLAEALRDLRKRYHVSVRQDVIDRVLRPAPPARPTAEGRPARPAPDDDRS